MFSIPVSTVLIAFRLKALEIPTWYPDGPGTPGYPLRMLEMFFLLLLRLRQSAVVVQTLYVLVPRYLHAVRWRYSFIIQFLYHPFPSPMIGKNFNI